MSRLGEALSAVELAPTVQGRLEEFVVIFKRWNEKINLSAARTDDDLEEHVIDSLHVVPHLRDLLRTGAAVVPRVLDVGSGGGLPAVVVALSLPGIHVTALEPVHKKHAFLRAAARDLRMPNLEAYAERLERHARGEYDAAMSRATFDLRDWLQLGFSRIAAGGVVLGFEGIARDDLPPEATRHAYALGSKTRAIIKLVKPRS